MLMFALACAGGLSLAGGQDPFADLDARAAGKPPPPPATTTSDPFADLDAKAAGKPPPAASSANDPFADLDATRQPNSLLPSPNTNKEQLTTTEKFTPLPPLASGGSTLSSSTSAMAASLQQDVDPTFWGGLMGQGFAFRKEIMSLISRSSQSADEPGSVANGLYSRQSVGFEVLKKFSTKTSTVAAFDLQMRLVRRDNFHEVLNDAEGASRLGWFLEYHNAYWDFYNIFNPLLGDKARSSNIGRFNLRVGRFYLPFGLNLQTDTHGPVLQLSNERNFGFERDWYAGFWGSINPHLNYDLYYMLGSGYNVAFNGQSGLLGTRVSLSNKYLNEYGLEGGLAFMTGQRLSPHALQRSPSVMDAAAGGDVINTLRYGADVRWRHTVPTGSITLTAEVSAGRDESDKIFTQLYQADYLTVNRKYGASVQYRRFNQGIQGTPAPMSSMDWNGGRTDASIIGELSWYLRNDLGNSNLHWIKLNVERKTEAIQGRQDTILTLQYYRYW